MNPRLKRLPARFYRWDREREPVREWLKDLRREDRKVIGEDIKDVEFSWPIGMPLVRSLGNELCKEQFAAGPDCADYFLCRAGEHGAASRLYEEEPKDAATGHRSGA